MNHCSSPPCSSATINHSTHPSYLFFLSHVFFLSMLCHLGILALQLTFMFFQCLIRLYMNKLSIECCFGLKILKILQVISILLYFSIHLSFLKGDILESNNQATLRRREHLSLHTYNIRRTKRLVNRFLFTLYVRYFHMCTYWFESSDNDTAHDWGFAVVVPMFAPSFHKKQSILPPWSILLNEKNFTLLVSLFMAKDMRILTLSKRMFIMIVTTQSLTALFRTSNVTAYFFVVFFWDWCLYIFNVAFFFSSPECK